MNVGRNQTTYSLPEEVVWTQWLGEEVKDDADEELLGLGQGISVEAEEEVAIEMRMQEQSSAREKRSITNSAAAKKMEVMK